MRIFAAMVGILLNSCSQRQNSSGSRLSHLKDQFQLDWSTERKACDSIHKAAGIFVFTEDVLEQLRSAVSHSRLLADIFRSGHLYAKPNNSLRRRRPCRSVCDFWRVPATTLELVFVCKSRSEQRHQLPAKTYSKMMPPAWIREL